MPLWFCPNGCLGNIHVRTEINRTFDCKNRHFINCFLFSKTSCNVQGQSKEGDYFYCTNITENIITRRSKLFIAFFSVMQQMILSLVKEDALITSAGCAIATSHILYILIHDFCKIKSK